MKTSKLMREMFEEYAERRTLYVGMQTGFVGNVVENMIERSRLEGRKISFVFNGIALVAEAEDKPQAVLDTYFDALEERRFDPFKSGSR